MAKSKRKLDLENAIEDMDFDTLFQLAAQNRTKRSEFSFLEYINKKNEDEKVKIISGLTKLLMSCIEKHLTKNGQGTWATADAEDCDKVGQVIQVVVDVALVVLQLNISSHCLVDLALLLNGILPEIPNRQDTVKNSIALYCEKMYATNSFEKCEYFLFNVLSYLLHRTLTRKLAKSDIKRVYSIRKVMETIVGMKESNKEELIKFFKQCLIKPVYISILEGQKVLGLMLVSDIDKISELHNIIKSRLLTINMVSKQTAATAKSYGRVYFEAWCHSIKSGRQDIKNILELSCLQDLLLTAIHSQPRNILPVIRKLLAQFHCRKKELEVSKMLYCLYQPLLWRFLKNPDGRTRANATQLFLDIFPLEDPEVKVVATDLELNDQLLMIKDLLTDEFPIVRMTTILGICISMSVNWEVFPEEMLKTYFRIIVNELSRDSTSAEVRCAVVKGIKALLENPLTVKVLVAILPKLAGLFHDISENVRIAFCKLLMKVKKISAIKYFQIVPLKHLFARLEEDSHAVKKSITGLINNSYFPRNEDPKIWMGRCLEIIKSERGAARVFFTYVSTYIGLENSIRFMVQAAKAVHFYVKTKQSSGQIDLSNKENIVNFQEYLSNLEQAVGFNNFKVVCTVMDSIAVLWLSLKTEVEKEENKCFLKMLVQKIGNPLGDLCLYYKDTEAWESVFYVSSYLPSSYVQCLGSLLFMRLRNLPHDAEPEDYMILLECLCNQHHCNEVLVLLKDWIETGLTDSYVAPPAKKRKIRGKSEIPLHEQPKPYLANRMLSSMFDHRGLQRAVLLQDQTLKEMLYFIDHIKRKLERMNARMMNEKEASFLSLLLLNIVKISVLLHEDTGSNDVLFLIEVVQWTDQKLVKHLKFSDDLTDNFTMLIYSICKDLCAVISDVVALGFCDPNSRIYLLFFEKMLRSRLGYNFALITSRFLYKHAASGQFLYLMENDTVMLRHLLESLCKIFDCFCDETFLKSMPTKEYKEVIYILASVMHIMQNHVALLNEPTSAVFRCILKNIIDSLLTKTTLLVEDLSDNDFDGLKFPKVGDFFMSIITQKPSVLPTYLTFLCDIYESSKREISFWIACWAIVYRALDLKIPHKPTLREAHVLVGSLEKTIHEKYPRKRNSEPENSPRTMKNVPEQMFQRHCHAEFVKLKSRLFSKARGCKKS